MSSVYGINDDEKYTLKRLEKLENHANNIVQMRNRFRIDTVI